MLQYFKQKVDQFQLQFSKFVEADQSDAGHLLHQEDDINIQLKNDIKQNQLQIIDKNEEQSQVNNGLIDKEHKISNPEDNNERVYFEIDTGFSYTIALQDSVVDELQLQKSGVVRSAQGIGGDSKFAFYEPVRVCTIQTKQCADFMPIRIGGMNLMGTKGLQKLGIQIDFENRRPLLRDYSKEDQANFQFDKYLDPHNQHKW